MKLLQYSHAPPTALFYRRTMDTESALEEAQEQVLALYAALASVISSGVDDITRRLAEETMKEAADYLASHPTFGADSIGISLRHADGKD